MCAVLICILVQLQSWVMVRVGVTGTAIQRLDCQGKFCFQNGAFTHLATWSQFSGGSPHLFPELLGCHVTSFHGDAGVILVNGSWIPQILLGSTRKEKVAGILWPSFKINSAFHILLVKAIKVQSGSRGERVSLFLMEEQCSMKSTWGWDVFHHSGLESQA